MVQGIGAPVFIGACIACIAIRRSVAAFAPRMLLSPNVASAAPISGRVCP